ncbi:MAG: DUF255 domain-containing protein [Cryomorphaceae bacterium]|nr:DUF255 domain-containing protein [Cryomorphaceae bacterium]
MRYLVVSLLLLAFSLPTEAQRRVRFIEVKNIEEWEDALEMAKDNKRLLFINICSGWSQVCKRLTSEVFNTRTMGRFISNNFVPIYIDGDSEFGDVWRDKYEVPGYPYLFYMTPGERIIERLEGYQLDSTIIESGRKAYLVYREYPRLREAYVQGGLSPKGWRTLIELELANEGPEGARPLFEEYISNKSKDKWRNGYNLALICTFGSAPGEEVYEFVLENRDNLRINPEFDGEKYFESSFNHSMALAVRRQDSTILQRLEDDIFSWSEVGGNQKSELAREMYRTYYLGIGDWTNFERIVNTIADNASSGRETVLALESRFLIENFMDADALKAAIRLMQKSVEARNTLEKQLFIVQALVNLKQFDDAIKQLQRVREAIKDPYDRPIIDEYISDVRRLKLEAEQKKEKDD